MYGYGTMSLTLRKEHALTVLRRISGPNRDEVSGGWRKQHDEELRIMKSKRKRWAGHAARIERGWGGNLIY
jgi:hypothetical protein